MNEKSDRREKHPEISGCFFRCIDKTEKMLYNYSYITVITNRKGDIIRAAKNKNYERHDRSGRR